MDTKKIGNFIREKRLGKNLTQSDLAELLHVSNKAVSKWECGRGIPDYEYIVMMCDIFGVTVDELLGRGVGKADYETGGKKGRGVLFFAGLVLIFAEIIGYLKCVGFFELSDFSLFLDIPTFLYIIGFINFIGVLSGTEADFWRLAVAGKKRVDIESHELPARIAGAVYIRMLANGFAGIFLAMLRADFFFVRNPTGQTASDSTYAILPVIYSVILFLTYLLLLRMRGAERVFYEKCSKLFAVGIFEIVILAGLIALNILSRKEVYADNDNIRVEVDAANNGYQARVTLNMPVSRRAEAGDIEPLLKTADKLQINDEWFISDDTLQYSEFDSIDELADALGLTFSDDYTKSHRQAGKWVYIKGNENVSDLAAGGNILYGDLEIKEYIVFRGLAGGSTPARNVANDIIFATKPELIQAAADDREIYYLTSDENGVAFILEGDMWYEFYVKGSVGEAVEFLGLY